MASLSSGDFQEYSDAFADYASFPDLTSDYASGDGFIGRTIAILYNQSSLVQYGAIAIGVFYLITAIGLIVYYISSLGGTAATTFGRSSSGGWWSGYTNEREFIDVSPWLLILAELEEAFAKYGVTASEQECRERLVCEAYMPSAVTVNKMAAVTISQVIGKLTPDVTGGLEDKDRGLANSLLKAANRGRGGEDCGPYIERCEGHAMKDLTLQKSDGRED